MRQKAGHPESSSERIVREIRRSTRKHHSAEGLDQMLPLAVVSVGAPTWRNCSLFVGWHDPRKVRFRLHLPSVNNCSNTPKVSSLQDGIEGANLRKGGNQVLRTSGKAPRSPKPIAK
jgi:hypothetical protein